MNSTVENEIRLIFKKYQGCFILLCTFQNSFGFINMLQIKKEITLANHVFPV